MKASQLLTYMIAGLIAMSILCALISFGCGHAFGQLAEIKRRRRLKHGTSLEHNNYYAEEIGTEPK